MRYTEYHAGKAVIKDRKLLPGAMEKLAVYENTGLTPEKITELKEHMNNGWIPVEDRLPEVGEYVLGTTKSGEVLIFRYGWNSPHTRKMFFHLCGAAATIIAWRPLPEPYRPKKESEGSRRLREREEFFKG